MYESLLIKLYIAKKNISYVEKKRKINVSRSVKKNVFTQNSKIEKKDLELRKWSINSHFTLRASVQHKWHIVNLKRKKVSWYNTTIQVCNYITNILLKQFPETLRIVFVKKKSGYSYFTDVCV